ncbi:MAG: hypothetical protein Ta2B_29640 [Termitinemataceae bacterium]|nr:MAG: hypothetical protein Ta2B_29640 [Termitinemataceae bacterium]
MTKFERICAENVPPYAVFVCVILLAFMFLIRAPVVIVSDEMFTTIYGIKREHYTEMEMSARIFRRIKILRMALDAKPEAVAFAVEDASRHPAFVVFPARYESAIERYVQDNPKTKCFLIADSQRTTANIQGVQIINTNTDIDYYRAGLFTALAVKLPTLDLETDTYEHDPNNTVLYMPLAGEDNPLNTAFYKGLRKKTTDVAVLNYVQDSTDLNRIFKVCVFLNGSMGILRRNNNFNDKIITRSWVDPLFTPPNTIVVFDDSPIVLLPEIAKLRLRKTVDTPIRVPSEIAVLPLRLPDIKLLPEFSAAIVARP